MNTGYWRLERDIDAYNDQHAVLLANEALPKRKKTDVTYMILDKVYALEEE